MPSLRPWQDVLAVWIKAGTASYPDCFQGRPRLSVTRPVRIKGATLQLPSSWVPALLVSLDVLAFQVQTWLVRGAVLLLPAGDHCSSRCPSSPHSRPPGCFPDSSDEMRVSKARSQPSRIDFPLLSWCPGVENTPHLAGPAQ